MTVRIATEVTRPLRDYLNSRFGHVLHRLDTVEERLARIEHQLTPATGPATEEPTPLVDDLPDFSHLLHTLRGIELSRMPPGARTMLSAGCANAGYFAWVSANYPGVQRHIGLELYLPEPDDLPPGVEWLKQSVSDMSGVTDGEIDLLFSGQNLEHLFGDDLGGFLLESHRVLREGGLLVVDSPHRQICHALNWTMPEHTIEFTPQEAAELVTLAGFDVESIRGLWLCREPDGTLLPLWSEPGRPLSASEVVRRSTLGQDRADDSFVWWLEARRSARTPDEQGLRKRHAQLFAHSWPERRRRLRRAVGDAFVEDGRSIVRVAAGTAGYPVFGPYLPLPPGEHRATFRLRRNGPASEADEAAVVARVDICGAGTPLAQRELLGVDLPFGVWTDVEVRADVPALLWGGEYRVEATGVAALDVDLDIAVIEPPGSVGPRPISDPPAEPGQPGHVVA